MYEKNLGSFASSSKVLISPLNKKIFMKKISKLIHNQDRHSTFWKDFNGRFTRKLFQNSCFSSYSWNAYLYTLRKTQTTSSTKSGNSTSPVLSQPSGVLASLCFFFIFVITHKTPAPLNHISFRDASSLLIFILACIVHFFDIS